MGCGYCASTSDSSTDSTLPDYFDYYGEKKKVSSSYNDNCPIAK